MTTFAIAPPPVRSLSIHGSDQRFAINRIFCVGRNYAAHAREMGSDPTRESPFFFMKQAQNAVDVSRPHTLPYPPQTKNFHHEIELVVALAKGGANISKENALEHVFGYGIGLDMTRRDLQFQARDAGRPWEFGKSFSGAAPLGPLFPAAQTGHLQAGAIALTVNGQLKQTSDLSKLIWSVAECISILSTFDTLEPGDLLMTGTPEGVGPVVRGDVLHGTIEGLGAIDVTIG